MYCILRVYFKAHQYTPESLLTHMPLVNDLLPAQTADNQRNLRVCQLGSLIWANCEKNLSQKKGGATEDQEDPPP